MAENKNAPRKFTAANGESLEIGRDVKILSATAHRQALGDGSGKTEHHRTTIIVEGGITYLVQETPKEVWEA